IAIEHFARAMRLNPLNPGRFVTENGIAAAHFLGGRYDDAASWSERALRVQPNYAPAMRIAAASHACAGRLAAAQQAMARMRQLPPDMRVANLAGVGPFRKPADITRYTEGLRRAGLPE